MNLFILRHGIALDPGEAGLPPTTPDAERPLSARGKKRLWRITEAMLAMELKFEVILSSPLLRARQTAAIVSEAMNLRRQLTLTDHLAPAGSPLALCQQINKLSPRPDAVLLVGHEPYLSQLIAQLLTGRHEAQLDLRKGGLAKLEIIGELHPAQCAQLAWLLTPKQLCLMA